MYEDLVVLSVLVFYTKISAQMEDEATFSPKSSVSLNHHTID